MCNGAKRTKAQFGSQWGHGCKFCSECEAEVRVDRRGKADGSIEALRRRSSDSEKQRVAWLGQQRWKASRGGKASSDSGALAQVSAAGQGALQKVSVSRRRAKEAKVGVEIEASDAQVQSAYPERAAQGMRLQSGAVSSFAVAAPSSPSHSRKRSWSSRESGGKVDSSGSGSDSASSSSSDSDAGKEQPSNENEEEGK